MKTNQGYVTPRGTHVCAGKVQSYEGISTVWVLNFEGVLESYHESSLRASTQGEIQRAKDQQRAEYEEHPSLLH